MIRSVRTALALLASALCGACAPVSVSFTLFGDDARLHETDVDGDRNAEAKVAVIDVRGLIADRGEGLLFTSHLSPIDELTARLRKAREDHQVKAVILRINSPGGTVTASDVMFREVRRFATETGRPVVASLSEIAASGGYYLALSSDYIIAEPTTITGSIGVIIPTVNISEGLGRLGVRSRSIVSRSNKDLANPLEPMREEHYQILQTLVDDFYERFRSLVVERRTHKDGTPAALAARVSNLDLSRLDDVADGRVLSGERAMKVGLVDATGGLPEAFDAAKALAGIRAARLVKYYREDADKPRTAYASSPVPPAAQTEINVLQLRMNGGLAGASSAGAYYLWIPPGGG
jgi:protease-4